MIITISFKLLFLFILDSKDDCTPKILILSAVAEEDHLGVLGIENTCYNL